MRQLYLVRLSESRYYMVEYVWRPQLVGPVECILPHSSSKATSLGSTFLWIILQLCILLDAQYQAAASHCFSVLIVSKDTEPVPLGHWLTQSCCLTVPSTEQTPVNITFFLYSFLVLEVNVLLYIVCVYMCSRVHIQLGIYI